MSTRTFVVLALAASLILSACSFAGASAPTSSVSSLPNSSSQEQDPETWSCNGAVATAQDQKNFRGTWGIRAYARWIFEAGCNESWPTDPTGALNAPIETDGGKIGLEPGLPYVVGSDGQAHALPIFISDCINSGIEQAWDGESHVTWCVGVDDEHIDILDAAFLGTVATPWPGDEEIIGVVWAARESGKLVLKVLVVGGTYAAASQAGAVLANNHTDPQHDPYRTGSQAQTIIAAIASFWAATGGPGGDPNRFRCLTLKVAGEAVRYFYWLSGDGSSGDFAVLNAKNGEWITAFGGKLAITLWNLPVSFARIKGAKMEGGCNSAPPPIS